MSIFSPPKHFVQPSCPQLACGARALCHAAPHLGSVARKHALGSVVSVGRVGSLQTDLAPNQSGV